MQRVASAIFVPRSETMIKELLEKRAIPSVLNEKEWSERREELKTLLCQHEYGYLPLPPQKMIVTVLSEETTFCASKATYRKVLLSGLTETGEFAIPIHCVVPNTKEPCPVVVHINFRNDVPDRYMPTEEIADHGFAVVSFGYNDVTMDNDDFTNGLAGAFFPTGVRQGASAGKIMLWAWAAMRVMDYLQEQAWADKSRIAVAGHSRLGKTALVTGALDERFSFVYSNDSGCCGAAISRDKVGESVSRICTVFPFWFCENFKQYIDNEDALPLDQHFLLSLIAPRHLYIASAQEDEWADPNSEFLGGCAVSPIYEMLGKPGLIAPDRLPEPGDTFHDGTIGYHLRTGSHYFSRYDWLRFMEYMNKHKD